MTHAPALEVRGLWKSYVAGVRGCSARVSVLRGVSFTVAQGERVGILGAPGAGKTTLLHCISGLRRPDSGFVRLNHPPSAPVLLLDDGWMEDTVDAPSSTRARLVCGRALAALAARVDRILVLSGGRVVALDTPRATPHRRVAEPWLCERAPT